MTVDVGGRLRAARPTIDGDPPPYSVVRARIERAATRAPAPNRHRTVRVALLLVAGALALAAAAWGAVSALSGSPVLSTGVAARPTIGAGQPVADSLGVLPLRAGDPAGGPPWAMRLIRTTRGLGCVQAGRLVNGRLGVLAIDAYVFGGDQRFHPFLAADAIDPSCVPLDAHGRVFALRGPQIVTADGLPTAGGNVLPSEQIRCDLPGSNDNFGARCPPAMLREIAVGFLGPDAVRIRLTEPGHTSTIAPYGPDGAYLVVVPAPPHANTGRYGALGQPAPGMLAMTVTFRDGSRCRIPNTTVHDICVAEGLVAQRTPSPNIAQVRTRVHAGFVRRLTGAPPPLASGDNGYQVPPGAIQKGLSALVMPPGPGLIVTFTARVGAPNLFSAYNVELHRAVVAGCFGGTALLGQGTDSTIAAGQTVRFGISLQPGCRGVYTGRVYYASRPETFTGGPGLAFNQVALPMLGPRVPGLHVVTVGRFRVTVP